jgi:hypothetical protein
MELLRGKPTTVLSIKSEATYEQIMECIHNNEIKDKHLRAVVNSCKSNPESVVFVIYRSYSDGVLMLFGKKPVCVRLEGSKLQTLMSHHCLESRIYVFSYVK